MIIRQATVKDTPSLADLVLASAPNTLAVTFDIDTEFSAIQFLKNSLAKPFGQYGYQNHWVAVQDYKIMGCISAWHRYLPDAFHQQTLASITDFYGLSQTLSVLEKSRVLKDCVPKPKEHEWCVGHLAVADCYQRQGVGSQLLKAMFDQALQSNKHTVSLDVQSHNRTALSFYLKHTFVLASESGTTQRMSDMGIGPHLHLVKTLT
jgi:ribosomal protein S18 acetylase RimI-like enzyme